MQRHIQVPLAFGLLTFACGGITPSCVFGSQAAVGVWQDGTEDAIGITAEYTNKVELADINGDGFVDLLFANGGNYDSPGKPECSRIFENQGYLGPEGTRKFREITAKIFGNRGKAHPPCKDAFLTRAIRVADFNDDGIVDLFLATSYQTQSQLYLGLGDGRFRNVTGSHLPVSLNSFGDATVGDVDGDGDLDLALADWGPGNPMTSDGGLTRLWLNDGQGHFTDVTNLCDGPSGACRMPQSTYVKFSWDLDFVDVDNDYDLDLMVSSKKSEGGVLLENDGHGYFTDVTSGRLPQKTNNYDFEAMDLNGDGFLDVVTINDGEWVNTGDPATDDPYARRNSVFFNDTYGGFVDVTADVVSLRDNPGVDDNLSIFLDVDSDGDADVLIGSLSGNDRVLLNDGKGNLHLDDDYLNTFTYSPPPPLPPKTPSHGTLGMAVADLDGDRKLDVVEGQGEVEYYFDERVYFGKNIPVDRAPPIIGPVEEISEAKTGNPVWVRARVHDNKSPTMTHDWTQVTLNWQAEGGQLHQVPMQWYGEYLWRAGFPMPASRVSYQVCASDAAGNSACSESRNVTP